MSFIDGWEFLYSFHLLLCSSYKPHGTTNNRWGLWHLMHFLNTSYWKEKNRDLRKKLILPISDPISCAPNCLSFPFSMLVGVPIYFINIGLSIKCDLLHIMQIQCISNVNNDNRNPERWSSYHALMPLHHWHGSACVQQWTRTVYIAIVVFLFWELNFWNSGHSQYFLSYSQLLKEMKADISLVLRA